MAKIKLELVKPTETTVYDVCSSISLPTTSGVMEILPGHEKMIVQLITGDILIKKKDLTDAVPVEKAFAVIDQNSCKVLVIE